LKTDKYPDLPEKLTFIHAEDILAKYPDLPRKQRETAIVQEYPAVFILEQRRAGTTRYPSDSNSIAVRFRA